MSACPSCNAAIAPGQRYCFACGERCSGMPAHVATMLGVPAAAEEPAPVAAAEELPRSSGTFSAPAVAVAVMAILGFGVIVGSVVSPPAESSQSPVIAVQQPPPATTPAEPPVSPPAKAAPAAAAPAAPVQQTVTQYVQAPTPTTPAPEPVAPTGPQLPDVKHLFLVVLPPARYDDAFGPDSKAPYLATDLTKKGELVPNYYAVTGSPLANKIALISGQGPNPDTLAGCTSYTDMDPGTESADTQQKGQVLGTGCVFPRSTLTLADELVANGRTWKAYVADPPPPAASRQDTTTSTEATPTDTTTTVTPATPPAQVCGRTPDTPFVSFHSVIDLPNCADSFGGMDQLTTDLSAATSTPSLAYIEPHLPDLAADDAFLKDLIPKITDSPAYKDGGLIAITFANSPQDGDTPDSSACCAEPVYPNIPAPPPADPAAPVVALPPGADIATGGGGRVGLLLMSPFVKAGTTAVSSYNHYSLLRSIEDLFGLQPTGYAGYLGLLAFDSVIYNAPATSS